MKTFLFLVMIVSMCGIYGCGSCSKRMAELNGKDEICVDGVKYFKNRNTGVTVKYRTDGKIELCK